MEDEEQKEEEMRGGGRTGRRTKVERLELYCTPYTKPCASAVKRSHKFVASITGISAPVITRYLSIISSVASAIFNRINRQLTRDDRGGGEKTLADTTKESTPHATPVTLCHQPGGICRTSPACTVIVTSSFMIMSWTSSDEKLGLGEVSEHGVMAA